MSKTQRTSLGVTQGVTFLYERQCSDILANPGRPFVVIGGWGIGKTSVLRCIESRLQQEGNVHFVDGRRSEQALQQVQQIAAATARRLTVLVDDVDILTFASERIERASPDSAAGLFWSLITRGAPFPNTVRVIVSTTARFWHPQSWQSLGPLGETAVANWAMVAASILRMQFEPVELDPWNTDWESHLRNLVAKAFSERRNPAAEVRWYSVLRDLTGGHPALLGPGIAELSRLIGLRTRTKAEDLLIQSHARSSKESMEATLQSWLENALARDALGMFWGRLERLRLSEVEQIGEAYRHLLSLAREGALDRVSLRVRQDLLTTGLVHADRDDNRLRIPGSLLQQEIAAMRPRDQSRDIVGTLEIRKPGRGTLSMRKGTVPVSVDLSGLPLELMQILWRNRERHVPLAELMNLTRREKAAVRSGLQRLTDKLTSAGLPDLLTNKYREGYRLRPPQSDNPAGSANIAGDGIAPR